MHQTSSKKSNADMLADSLDSRAAAIDSSHRHEKTRSAPDNVDDASCVYATFSEVRGTLEPWCLGMIVCTSEDGMTEENDVLAKHAERRRAFLARTATT